MVKESLETTSSHINRGIAFIGAGNVAWHLAKKLSDKGIPIKQIYSRTQESASSLGTCCKTNYTTNIAKISKEAGIYIICLPDNQVKSIVSQIAFPKEAIIIHTAGSLDVNILINSSKHIGVLYPLQTFSKEKEVDLTKATIFIEGSDNTTEETLIILAKNLSTNIKHADSKQRSMIHLAAVFSCNFVNHLYTVSTDLLGECDIDFSVLSPLIEETTRKAMVMPAIKAQTGPAVRKDTIIMEKHLSMLENTPEYKEIYKLLSKSIINRHEQSND